MTESAESKPTEKKASFRFFTVLFFISLALNFFLFFRYARPGMQLEKNHAGLIALLEQSNVRADSLKAELDATMLQMQEQLNENLALTDLKEEYRLELEQKLSELEETRARISGLIASGETASEQGPSYATLATAKQEIEELKTSNAQYQQEMDDMLNLYTVAQEAVDQYSIQAQDYLKENDSLIATNTALILEAGQMRINDLWVTGLRERRSETIESLDASKIEKLKISFKVLGSRMIPRGEKELVFRILGTSNEVLTDHVTELTDSKEVYSFKQVLEYDGQDLKVTVFYKQKAKYKKGTHILQILHEGKILDTQVFVLD